MQTVRVLSTLALKGAVTRLAGRYEAASGLRIDADFAPTVGLMPGCAVAKESTS
jgi:molybdate transport system substrate-binding protein